MAKLGASAEGSSAVRPPRPARRERLAGGTPNPAAVSTAVEADGNATEPGASVLDTGISLRVSSPNLGAINPAAINPAAINPAAINPAAMTLDPEIVIIPPESSQSTESRATPPLGMLLPAVVERRSSELLVLDVPLASLEQPSTTLEPTPSPVPRVSLVPATRGDAGLANPSSRNQPTVAARHAESSRVAVPRAAVPRAAVPRAAVPREAMAVTVPPQRGPALDGKIARRLAADVRSSKREIVLGLTSGMALAAALGVIGQRYLTRREPISRDAALPAAAIARGTSAEPMELTRARGESRDMLPAVSATEVEPKPQITRHSRPLDASKRPKLAAGSSVRTRTAGTPTGGAATDPFAPEPRGAGGELLEDSEPKAKAPLSPAESAGLGLDLTF